MTKLAFDSVNAEREVLLESAPHEPESILNELNVTAARYGISLHKIAPLLGRLTTFCAGVSSKKATDKSVAHRVRGEFRETWMRSLTFFCSFLNIKYDGDFI